MIKTARYKAIYKETVYYVVPVDGETLRDATEQYYNGNAESGCREAIHWTNCELVGIVGEDIKVTIPFKL